MKDLYRCLAEHPPQLWHALAEIWHAPLSGVEGLEQVSALGEAMLAPLRIEQVVEQLSPDARQALSLLVAHDGALPAHRLAGFGAIRRFGPARMARERPWIAPDNPLEELFYRGVVYRAYGTTETQLAEIILVPDQILERLRDLPGSPLDEARLLPTPSDTVLQTQVSEDVLCEDVLAILVAVRVGRVRPRLPQDPAQRSALQPEDLDLGRRLRGPRTPEHLALLYRLLWRLRLVRLTGRALQPTLRAREWLKLPDLRRAYTTMVAWRDDPHRDDLIHLESLRIEGALPEGRTVTLRRALLQMLAELATDEWVALEPFVRGGRRVRPDLLRKQGELSWSVRDAQTGRYLDGMETWDDVEGALIRHLLTHPLFWLGLVDLGLTAEGALVAFRSSERARALLAAPDAEEELPEDKGRPAAAEVADDLTVRIPVAGTMYDRYQLERFAEWSGQDAVAVYRLTPESVWQGATAEITTGQILGFLRRISGGRASAIALRTLQEWGERYGRAFVRRPTLLETADEATMEQVDADPRLHELLGEQLSPRIRVVPDENVEVVTALLRDLGIWPILR